MAADFFEESEEKAYKVIIVGDGSVGKTSIAKRFYDDSFGPEFQETVGLHLYKRAVPVPDADDVLLQVWDIGSHAIGGNMVGSFVSGARAVILVYDLTNYQSFLNLDDWYRLIRKTFGEALPVVCLVGNKSDLPNKRAVRQAKHTDFVNLNDFQSFFTCARTGENINSLFNRIAVKLSGTGAGDVEAALPGSVRPLHRGKGSYGKGRSGKGHKSPKAGSSRRGSVLGSVGKIKSSACVAM